MAVVTITGTIRDASGGAAEGVIVRLTPYPRDPDSPEAIDGIGLLLQPVEVLSDADGAFAVDAVVGFQYAIEIPDAGVAETFVAPAAASVRFDLLGIRPVVEQTRTWTPPAGGSAVAVTLRCARVDTVRTRFDEVLLERFDGAAWTTVDAVDLTAGLTTYDVVDNDPGTAYRARYRRTASEDVSEWSDEVQVTADPSALVISVDELKDIYLFGVDLTGDDGTEFPRRMLEHYIRAAVAWLEKQLDLSVAPVEIVDEEHDHYSQDYSQWGYIQLDTWPVQAVRKVGFRYPSMTEESLFPSDYVQLADGGAHGVIQIVPGRGGLSDVLVMPGSLLPMWSSSQSRVPGVWRVSYRAGWEPGQVPADLRHVVGMQAAIGPLNVAGDLIAGAGIATVSTSVPGLSQSIGTTSSATNSGYGSRILEYQKEIKDLLPGLKHYYGKTLKMAVV